MKVTHDRLPENPVASPGPIVALKAVKKVGSFLFGFGLLGAALHYLRVGPEVVEDEESG